ncbi:Ig-like domain-containing protein, partial [Nanoarchaeota archaeon]
MNKKIKKGSVWVFACLIVVVLACVVMAATLDWDPLPPIQLTCTQNQTCYFNFTANSTPSGAVINYTLDEPPFSQNIDSSTGELNFTPTNAHVGGYDVVAIAKEIFGPGIIISRINWTIENANDPPYVITYYPLQLSNLTVPENQTFYFNVTASDPDLGFGDYINYTWMENGVVVKEVLNSTTFEANYTPDFLSLRTNVIRVNITDSFNVTTYINWTINVTDVNRKCSPNGTIPNLTIAEDIFEEDVFTLYQYFKDNDTDNYPLSFDVSGNLNITVDINQSANNNVSFYPDANFTGINTIRYRCYDGYDYSIWSNYVVVNVTNIQDAPKVTPVDNQIAYVGAQFPVAQINATEVDFEPLTFWDNTSLFNINPATGQINEIMDVGDIGNYSINITVGDGIENVSIVFNVTVKNNSAPVLAPIGDRFIVEGSTFSLDINATDEDVIETLVFDSRCNNCSYPPPSSGIFDVATIDSTPDNGTGRISFTSAQADVGSWEVTFYVNDTRDAFDNETIVITVGNIQFDPVLTFIPNQTLKNDTLFELIVTATDADENIKGFTDNTSLFDIQNTTVGTSPASGTISFTPTVIGEYYVNITVRDYTGRLDQQVVLFNVTENRPPVIDPIINQVALEDSAFSLTVTAQDPDPQDQPNLVFTDNTTLFDISSSGIVSFTPNASQVGNFSIEINVTDGEYVDSEVFNLTVEFYDDFPYWVPSLDLYYVNETNYLTTSVWNSSEFDLVVTNRTIWNSSIWQDNLTTIYMDGYDEETNRLIFNLTFLAFTNASNDTFVPTFDLFTISNFDNDTAEISFTPTNSQVGNYSINFSIYDNTSRTTYEILELIVHNVNDAPVITGYSPDVNANMTENDTKTFEINATDIDFGDQVFYRWYYEDVLISEVTNYSYE